MLIGGWQEPAVSPALVDSMCWLGTSGFAVVSWLRRVTRRLALDQSCHPLNASYPQSDLDAPLIERVYAAKRTVIHRPLVGLGTHSGVARSMTRLRDRRKEQTRLRRCSIVRMVFVLEAFAPRLWLGF
jgi:hypothetical protein